MWWIVLTQAKQNKRGQSKREPGIISHYRAAKAQIRICKFTSITAGKCLCLQSSQRSSFLGFREGRGSLCADARVTSMPSISSVLGRTCGIQRPDEDYPFNESVVHGEVVNISGSELPRKKG